MSAAENICPVCKESNEIEAVVCGHCGTALEDPFMDPGAKTRTANMPAVTLETSKDWSREAAAVPPARGIAIYVEGESDPVYIDSTGEFVIGRKVASTAELAEGLLDLSPFGGYGRGLSRQHVMIRWTSPGYEILDLGSVNGTWLNNERLVPHQYYPLASGAHLRLGNLQLFVLYKSAGKTE